MGVKISLLHYGKNALQTEGVSDEGCKWEEVTGASRKLRNLELDNLYSPIIVTVPPIPGAALPTALVCCLSPNETASSNPAEGMDICLLCDVCCQVEVSATGPSLVQ
jgi:hypothetical protein